jgi:hypothetical protein
LIKIVQVALNLSVHGVESTYIDRDASNQLTQKVETNTDKRQARQPFEEKAKSLNLSSGHNTARDTSMPRHPRVQIHPGPKNGMFALEQSHTKLTVHTI